MADLPDSQRVSGPRRLDTAWLGIAFAILVQCGACLWWASKADTRISKLEADVVPVRGVVEEVARLDERTKGLERVHMR